MERTKKPVLLSTQLQRKVAIGTKEKYIEYEGNFGGNNISTGSTLLDLAISGGRVRGGGLPSGILVEIFGPSGSGKTVLLSEIAGNIQAKGGEVKFHDPEARLNQQFAKMFGLELKKGDYYRPDTIPEVFKIVRSWEPKGKEGTVHGIMADSLAALSTDQEMDKEEGDKMGMRRAKEFSEELRKTCRILAQNNFLMVCSNQVRVNIGGGDWGPKYTTPGGEAVGFYSSLRLKTQITKKIKKEKSYHGKTTSRVIGVEIDVEVFKNSVWKPFRTAPVTIIFDYGVDDIRQNLQFVKNYSKSSVYTIGDESLDKSMDEAILKIEEDEREEELRQEVIQLWNKIESQFNSHRKSKRS
jgi:recombination protein RecA